MTVACPSDEVLQSWLKSDSEGPSEAALASHIESCAPCHAALERLTALEPAAHEASSTPGLLTTLPLGRSPGENSNLGAGAGVAAARWATPPVGLQRLRPMLSSGTPPPDGTATPGRRATTPEIPGYEVLAELGRGGMGVVYQARQLRPRRVVALKMISGGAQATQEAVVRFGVEGETVARLAHPNIVQLYEVGAHKDQPFFVLEYMAGGSLEGKLGGKPQPPAAAAELIETLARAMHHAHQLGIVHRDLKPANVLLAADGTPKIADFGLAKLMDGDLRLTRSGAMAGTPSYMAPEQARPDQGPVGTAADTYALGTILFECLTGRPPFVGTTPLEVLRQVAELEPVAPRQLQPTVPRDLETICLTCLAKDPRKRYPSALALAEDLRRFQSGEPIRARRAGLPERALLWCRRNQLPAALMALVTLTLFAGIVTASFFAVRANLLALRALADEDRAVAEKHVADDRLVAMEEARNQAEAARAETHQNLYYAEMHLGGQSRHDNRALTGVNALLARWHPAPGQRDLRGWEWHYLDALGRQDLYRIAHGTRVLALAWDPAHDRLATVGLDGVVRVWSGADGALTTMIHGPPANAVCVAWSPDGAKLATGGTDGIVRLWDARSGAILHAFAGHKGQVDVVSWRPQGGRLGSASLADKTARIRDLSLTQEDVVLHLQSKDLKQVCWDRDWTRLAIAAATEVLVLDLVGAKPPLKVADGAETVSWSPDGKSLALSHPTLRLRVVDADTGKALQTLQGHRHSITATHWAKDNRTLCSVGRDHAVHLWDTAEGRLSHTFLGHTDELFAVAWSPDGERLATAGNDSTVRVWPNHRPIVPVARTLTSVSWSADSMRLACAAGDGTVHRFARQTLQPLAPWKGVPVKAFRVAWSPKGRHLACAALDGKVRVMDDESGDVLFTLPGHPGGVRGVSWSPDGSRLATVATDAKVRIWDVAQQAVVATLEKDGAVFHALAWSPDGTRLAAAATRSIHVWEMPGRKLLATLDHEAFRVERLSWSPDGRRLAAGDTAGVLNLWDVATRKRQERPLPGNRDWFRGLAWSPDGKRLAGAVAGSGVQIWDPATGRQAFASEPAGDLADLAWSPDGTALAGVSGPDGFLVVWDAAASYRYHRAPHKLHCTHLAGHLETLMAAGDTAAAVALVRQAQEDDPRARSLARLAAETHRKVGDYLRARGRTADAESLYAQARTQYERLLATEPSDGLAARALTDLLLDIAPHWQTLQPHRLTSAGGATLTLLPDNSVLASGPNPPRDTFTVFARTDLPALTAIRLETLPDARLPYAGSGRLYNNGNFLLSGFRLGLAGPGNDADRAARVPLTAALADYSRPAGPAAHAVDDLTKTAWDTFPLHHEPHWLLARTDSPVVIANDTSVHVTLDFQDTRWPQTALGRFRLSASADPRAYLAGFLRSRRAPLGRETTWLAAAYLLAGEAPAALRLLALGAGPDATPDAGDRVHDWLLLALAHHQLGTAGEAQRAYDRSVAWFRRNAADDLLRELALEATVRVEGVTIHQARTQFTAWQTEARR